MRATPYHKPAVGVMGARMVAMRARAQPRAESRAKLLELAYTVSAVALAARLIAMAEDPAACIARLSAAFALSETGIADIEGLVRIARQDGAELEAYTREVAAIFADDPATRADLVDLLFEVGAGETGAAEVLAYLGAVAARLEVPEPALERIAARHLDPAHADPYALLGIGRDAPDEAVRAAWRRQAQGSHPDALAARGVAPAIVRAAAPRFAAINAAYDAIRAARGRK